MQQLQKSRSRGTLPHPSGIGATQRLDGSGIWKSYECDCLLKSKFTCMMGLDRFRFVDVYAVAILSLHNSCGRSDRYKSCCRCADATETTAGTEE
jgi:hypothetical protein